MSTPDGAAISGWNQNKYWGGREGIRVLGQGVREYNRNYFSRGIPGGAVLPCACVKCHQEK